MCPPIPFRFKPPGNRLPGEYVQVDHLNWTAKSSAYIPTGLLADATRSSFTLTIKFIGAEVLNNRNYAGYITNYLSANASWHMSVGYSWYSGNAVLYQFGVREDGVRTWEWADISGKTTITITPSYYKVGWKTGPWKTGTASTDFPQNIPQSDSSKIYLCYTAHPARTISFSANLYEFKYWNSSDSDLTKEPYTHMVPCYRKTDKWPGMFDIKRGMFFSATANNGTFIPEEH